ncbi:galactokinase [Loxospora ochrophaea]|nr:galactokinase [Loxospora ochrophaea]
MDDPVPINNSLDALYPPAELGAQMVRWNQLISQFSKLYNGKLPGFVGRSPGRVNLLGEHIDYSLYEVLPMGIAEDVCIAVRAFPSGGMAKVAIANIKPDRFKSNGFNIEADGSVEIDASTHEWTNYFKAGLRGAMGLLKQKISDFSPTSMEVLVDGTVPAGGGLSSSAAFVCASALTVLRANGQEQIIKRELVELAIVSERAVGVNSGGMDQAASVSSIRGDALSVSFHPNLHAEAIAFPMTKSPITFMIAQSFVAADKHTSAPRCYNLRVVECTLAAEFIASKLGLTLKEDSSSLGRSLRGLQEVYFDSRKGTSDGTSTSEIGGLKTMLSLVEEHLPKDQGYTRAEIAQVLQTSVADLESRYMTKFPVDATDFMLRSRALHVLNEAIRVSQFKSLLKEPPSDEEVLFTELGALMNNTQESCRDVYSCSCPELDELCEIAKGAGAYGSRLTGAGWGGCTVHLIPKDRTEEIRKAWEEKYYRVKFPEITSEKLAEAVVVTEPGHGSMMYVRSLLTPPVNLELIS